MRFRPSGERFLFFFLFALFFAGFWAAGVATALLSSWACLASSLALSQLVPTQQRAHLFQQGDFTIDRCHNLRYSHKSSIGPGESIQPCGLSRSRNHEATRQRIR